MLERPDRAAQVHDLFTQIDVDGSGDIDYAEFAHWRGRPRAGKPSSPPRLDIPLVILHEKK
jgi:hypothetical protein